MATKERLPRRGANGISDCQSCRMEPIFLEDSNLNYFKRILSQMGLEGVPQWYNRENMHTLEQ